MNVRVETLEEYKRISETSKDDALQTLAEIRGLLVGIQSDILEVKKDYHELRKDFQNYKDNTKK
jgi:hypothetical protein